MKKLAFAWVAAVLLGCSGSVDVESTSGGGKAGAGGEGASSSGGGGSTGDGGTGGTGGLFQVTGGGGTGTTTEPMGCSVVLDEQYHVSLLVDGEPVYLPSDCNGNGASGPYAAVQHPKGGASAFVIEACKEPDNGLPHLGLAVFQGEKNTYAKVQYSDASAFLEGSSEQFTFTYYGEPWDSVKGEFQAKLTTADGGAKVLDGKLHLCRRPDLYAP